MKKKKKQLFSVIIPAYKQEKIIRKNLYKVEEVLRKLPYDYEIICVVDGQIDKTLKEARAVKLPKVKVYSYERNKGKGFAVGYGMARSRGEIVAFMDAGMDFKPASLPMLLAHFEWYQADIIVGSKRHPVSKINYPLQRRILSQGYQLLVRFLFGLKIRDTQSGIKVFKRKVIEDVLPRLLVKQFAFDIEILSVARRLGYKRIYEAPIEMNWNRSNSVLSKSLWKTIINMFIDTLAVFYRLKILRYYDKKIIKKS
jgi:glycosyltransferase involved in cell wall biosynthesis